MLGLHRPCAGGATTGSYMGTHCPPLLFRFGAKPQAEEEGGEERGKVAASCCFHWDEPGGKLSGWWAGANREPLLPAFYRSPTQLDGRRRSQASFHHCGVS
jgi:hypothetical protein